MHWRNSNFQNLAFIVGATHTPDEAYRVILSQMEERENSIEEADISRKKIDLKKRRLEYTISNSEGFDKEEAELDLEELFSKNKTSTGCYNAAIKELGFLVELKDVVEPFRKYKDLPDTEAHQMIQSEEWAHEFIYRAQNQLAVGQGIDPVLIKDIRQHPSGDTLILPIINEMIKSSQEGTLQIHGKYHGGFGKLLLGSVNKETFNLIDNKEL